MKKKIIASLEYADYGMTFSSGCSVLACICMILQTGNIFIKFNSFL